ncbi:MAG: PAS domain S-box protein, partial [Candidatus Heimdallarchaeaceae archaeon]
DKEISNKTIQKVINKEIPVADIEKRYITKQGSIIPVRLTVWEVFNLVGKPHYFVGTIEDISEKKEAEENLRKEKEFANSIIDSSNSLIFGINQNYELVLFNKQMEEMTGTKRHYVLGKNALESPFPEEVKEGIRRAIEELKDKKVSLFTIQSETKGSPRATLWQSTFIKRDKEKIYIFIGVDITEQILANKKIEDLNESLRIINDILRHDIGNNVAIIDGSIDAFFDVREDAFLEMTKHAIDKSFDLIEKMESLEGLLIEDKKLEEIDVRKIVEKVIVGYTATSVSIKIEGNGIIIADNAISSVMDNLIGNAIKHGKADEIVVSINPGEHHCIIEVADNGKGVPEKYKKMLFRQGFKYGETAGSGLGLYIVKKTLERYGGDVTIRDNSPKGSIFQLKIKTPTT